MFTTEREIKLYYAGYRAALFDYTVWKNGEPLVGMGRHLSDENKRAAALEAEVLKKWKEGRKSEENLESRLKDTSSKG